MSATKITKTRYECKCELPDCPGNGASWLSKDNKIPDRCNHCGRRTWNRKDARNILTITALGKTQKLSEWSTETGLSKQLIAYRIRRGWFEEEAVTVPAGGQRPSQEGA